MLTERLPGEHSPFWIASALEIRQHLRTLVKRKERVTLWLGEQRTVSMVLAVSEQGDLLLDVDPEARVNARLLGATELLLSAHLDGVELKAAVGPLRAAVHDGLPALGCAAPLRLHRLQRREFHRMPIPAGHRVRCQMPAPPLPQSLAVALLDISLGGVCLVVNDPDATALAFGTLLPDCRLELHDQDPFAVDLEVRHVESRASRGGTLQHKVGCRFVHLDTEAHKQVQRYLTQLELDRRALSG